MAADPSVYHLPASGREEITIFPGTLATTADKMPAQRLLWEIPSASSSFVNPFLLVRGPCAGGGFCRCWDPQAAPSHGAGMGAGSESKDNPCAPLALGSDGLLLARGQPLGCHTGFFFPTLVQDFPVSWSSGAVPAPGSHGSRIAGTGAPSDQLGTKLEGKSSSRSSELGIRVGHGCSDQAGGRGGKAIRTARSSFHHLSCFQPELLHDQQSGGPSTSLSLNQILRSWRLVPSEGMSDGPMPPPGFTRRPQSFLPLR